ncbi:unnamed protein product [Schistosoma rodhaini]|uniref:SH2 domain-containing protein n=1 Tax=Schistosoma mansoni TaxID=6183 RepID=A0A3Q0KG85_SCHMA|nr:unnamed protein product [Schistosoma rodhaini]
MRLEHSSVQSIFFNHGVSSLLFDIPILAQISLTNLILLFFMINSSVDSEMDDFDDNGNRLVRRKWCPWSSWSPCSPTKCFKGFVNKNPSYWSNREELLVDDDTQITHCVLIPKNSTKKPNRAYVQQTIQGQHKILIPEKQRFRTCDCQSVSLLNVFRLVSRHECFPGDTVFECSECGSNEKIYLSRDNSDSDANLIPYCSYEQSNFQLYKILGGIIGAIGIICLLVCIIRFLVKQICGNQRIHNRTPCGGGSGASTNTNSNNASNRPGRRRNRSPQLQNNHRDDATEYLHNDYSTSVYPVGIGNLDLPPAYTDVVKLSAIETESNNNNNNNTNNAIIIPDAFSFNLLPNEQQQIINPSFLSKSSSNHTHQFNCALYDNEQNATSSQILNITSTDIAPPPPPPSYEEIVAATNAMKINRENDNSFISGNKMNIAQVTHQTEDTVTTTTANNSNTTYSGSNLNTGRTETSSS